MLNKEPHHQMVVSTELILRINNTVLILSDMCVGLHLTDQYDII